MIRPLRFVAGLALGLVGLSGFAGFVPPAAAASSVTDQDRQMIQKYIARCALAEGQVLEAAAPDGGAPLRFPGSLGVAPEWLDGTCGAECQQKVSACLIALTNRTGKHVELSVLSGSPAFGASFRPSAQDLPFPHQEGAFFGNLFEGSAFACRGRDVEKAPQVKRFCAVAPETCSGVAQYRDAGRCDDVCQQECRTLSDGSQRCSATVCRDPDGGVWRFPITTYLRNRIEAGNADRVAGSRRVNEQLDSLDRGDSARFALVDFGRRPRPVATLALLVAGRGGGGRIEAWLDGKHGGRRLGTLAVPDTAGAVQEQTASLDTRGIKGRHTLILKVVAGRNIGRLSTVEVR